MSEYIAGSKTISDWKIDKQRLIIGGDKSVWNYAFNSYFVKRLETRYLEPIRVIKDAGLWRGEGFSIVAIQCSLIEFLQSTVKGVSYKYLKKGEKLGPHEYSSSSSLFKEFLISQHPFASHFTSAIAGDFYVNIRCALLHEARTKGGWKIHACGEGKIIEPNQKILYRNDFQSALEQYIESYGLTLENDINYQEAFIRKFDSLST